MGPDKVPVFIHSVIQKTFDEQLPGPILEAGDTVVNKAQKFETSQWSQVSCYS